MPSGGGARVKWAATSSIIDSLVNGGAPAISGTRVAQAFVAIAIISSVVGVLILAGVIFAVSALSPTDDSTDIISLESADSEALLDEAGWVGDSRPARELLSLLKQVADNDAPVARIFRDAKLMEIGAGTSEIRRMLIGRELFEETK